MKKIIICFFVVLWTRGIASAVPTRDLLAHSSGDSIWFARVVRPDSENTPSTSSLVEQTLAYARQNGPGQSWQELPPVAGRAIAMASSSSQLVLLMAGGQWQTVWSDGSSTGQPLPAGGRILTIADDGENLWAIGAVAGGRTAADEAIVRELAATRPTTSPVIPITAAEVPLAEPATTRSVPESRLVVFRQVQGKWKTFAELPREVLLLSEGNASLTIVGGMPVVAYKLSPTSIQTLQWTSEQRWHPAAATPSAKAPIEDFQLFTDGSKPLLWWGQGNSAGQLVLDARIPSPTIKLDWNNGKAESFESFPAVTFAGGFIRVLRLQARNVFEQRYEEAGQPQGLPAELLVPADAMATPLVALIEAVFLVAVAFSVGASIYHQWTQSQTPPAQTESPIPAPLTPRFFAGLIDLIPVISAAIYLYFSGGLSFDSATGPSLVMIEVCAGAIGVYLLHTTVLELVTARSAGKWVFGLRVVTTEGHRPQVGQILIRDSLRLVDPLIMIMVSPLRQRSADVVAGTMVVRVGEPEPASTEAAPESHAESPSANRDSK